MCVSLLQNLRRRRQQLLLEKQILGKHHQQLWRGHSVSTPALWVVVSLTMKWIVVRKVNNFREREKTSHWLLFGAFCTVFSTVALKSVFLLRPRYVGWVGLAFSSAAVWTWKCGCPPSRILFSVFHRQDLEMPPRAGACLTLWPSEFHITALFADDTLTLGHYS